MKKSTKYAVAAGLALALVTGDVFARGFRGGGGMRGGARPSVGRSPSMSRSPSFNQPSVRPGSPSVSRPSPRPGPGVSEPNQGQLQQFLSLPGIPGHGKHPRPGDRPGIPERPKPGDRPGIPERPKPGDRPGIPRLPGHGDRPGIPERPGFGDRPGIPERPDLGDRWERLKERADAIRDHFQDTHPQLDFWMDHPHAARWSYPRPYRRPTAVAVTNWLAWDAAGPYYYDYADDDVYLDDEQVATAEETVDEATQLADAGAKAIGEAVEQETDVEWTPLGVFALTAEEKGDPVMYLQLALSKEGIISGSYHNSATGQTLPVQGSVGNETQRAAWSVGDNRHTVMETGVYNLTKEETPVLIHFGPQRAQTWLLTRMKEAE